MGCFPTCFTSSSSKRRLKHHNSIKPTLSEQPVLQTSGFIQPNNKQAKREENVGKLINLIRESSKEEIEDQVNFCAKKRVTFDLNGKASEESPAKKDGSFDLVEKNEDEKKSGKDKKTFKEIEPLFDTTTLSKMVPLNPNNRYQGCRNSTDEYEDKGLQVSDFEEEEEEEDDDDIDDSEPSLAQDESSESLFSLSIDSRKQVCDTEKGENEVNSRMLPCSLVNDEVKGIGGLCGNSGKRCRFGDSVLNPIENLTQWKKVKQRATPQQHVQQHRDKENVSFVPDLRSINNGANSKLCETKPGQQQIGVDTSLSSWLVGCEDMDIANSGDSSVENPESEIANSIRRPENGESLGDLAIDELNQCPTRSRIQSSDAKTPIKGTVWSYWVHTGQDMDSDSTSSREMPKTARENRKDQKVHFNYDSFEGRLDRALDMSLC